MRFGQESEIEFYLLDLDKTLAVIENLDLINASFFAGFIELAREDKLQVCSTKAM